MGGIADYSGSLVLQVCDALCCSVLFCAVLCCSVLLCATMLFCGVGCLPGMPVCQWCCVDALGEVTHALPAALQMPLAEACHVAVQRQPAADAGVGRLRIVSLNAEAAGRGPAFEMDVAELVRGRWHAEQ
jgi:hypothetical protein